jgi:hypothetical protein
VSFGTHCALTVFADLNGDAKIDMIVGNLYAASVTVYLGNGDGTFGSPANYGVDAVGGSGGVYSVALADFTGTGKLDIAAANYNTNTVSVLLGNGDGTFGLKTDFSVGANPEALVTGDFHGTGNLDIAAVNSGGTTVSVLSGNGDGTFAAATSLTVGNGPAGIITGDYNGDGKLDLAVANSTDNTISILIGN